MAVTAHTLPYFVQQINAKAVSLTADTFKMALMVNALPAWTGTQQAWQFVSTVIAACTEVSSGGYARVSLASTTNTFTGEVNTFSCASPISFGSPAGLSAASAIIFDSSIGASVDSATPVFCAIDFGQTVTSTGGAWTYTVSGSGLVTWTSS